MKNVISDTIYNVYYTQLHKGTMLRLRITENPVSKFDGRTELYTIGRLGTTRAKINMKNSTKLY